MFDKLIESNSAGAEFKPRRTFFMVSFVVVGIVFLSALVFDLYAADIDLGTDNFELVDILAPVETEVPKPKPAHQQPQRSNEQQPSERPSRQDLIARMDQPQQAPTAISTTPNTHRTIPFGPFDLNAFKPESDGRGAPVGPAGTDTTGSSSAESKPAAVDPVESREPPPAAKPPVPKKPVSIGVVNGKAIDLPKPVYSAAAIAVRAEGEVSVQVTIDENGKVISAKALNGHPMLKGASEKAAWSARFTPTLLSKVPVKVTGVIIYKFSRS